MCPITNVFAIRGTASKVHYFNCDIRSPEKVAEAADKIRAQVGHPTVLINNAGVVRGKTVLDAQPADVRFTFDVNALAHYWTVQAFLPDMVKKNHGMVVTVVSYAAWMPFPNLVDYAASKAAAMAFHEGLAAELRTRYKAPKVRTVVVHPGYTKTALFTGYGRPSDFVFPHQQPDSVADAVVQQLLSGRSGEVVLPGTGLILSALRLLPDWFSAPRRVSAESYMSSFRGRQVVEDVSAPYP